jgi:hypothetical protein
MHTYLPGDEPAAAGITTRRFRRAEDVVGLAAIDPRIGRSTWPEIWHLDDGGAMTCCLRGCTCDSLMGWARDPSPLLQLRLEGIDLGSCGSDWVLIESRPGGNGRPAVDSRDSEAFVLLRSELYEVGVRLLDALVFDDRGHWWSMHELADGTTEWRA